MHFFRRRPYFFFPSSSSFFSSFRPPSRPCVPNTTLEVPSRPPAHQRQGRQDVGFPWRAGAPLSSLPPHLLLGPPSPLLSSPLPARLSAWLAMCVCVARARLKFQFVASSSHVAAAAPLVSTSARPRPSSSCRRRVRSPSRFPSPGGDGSLPFPAGEGTLSFSSSQAVAEPYLCVPSHSALHCVWYITVADASLLTNVVVA